MKYQCRHGHIANDPDYCRACLSSNYGVTPVEQAQAAPPESRPEELTPVLDPVAEAASLPEFKHAHPSRKR